jgi:hypothetical protein
MSNIKTSKKSTSRRAFFQDVTAGATGVAVASALAQLGAPVMAAAQESKTPAPKQASSPFFKILQRGRPGPQAPSMTIYSPHG